MKAAGRIFWTLVWLGGLAVAGTAALILTASRVGEHKSSTYGYAYYLFQEGWGGEIGIITHPRPNVGVALITVVQGLPQGQIGFTAAALPGQGACEAATKVNCSRVVLAANASADFKSPLVLRLCLVVEALKPIVTCQLRHRAERFGVFLPQNTLTIFQNSSNQCFCLIVAAHISVQGSDVADE